VINPESVEDDISEPRRGQLWFGWKRLCGAIGSWGVCPQGHDVGFTKSSVKPNSDHKPKPASIKPNHKKNESPAQVNKLTKPPTYWPSTEAPIP